MIVYEDKKTKNTQGHHLERLSPHGQEDKQQDPAGCKEGATEQALHDNLLLQSPEVLLLDSHFSVKDHQPGKHADEGVALCRQR